MQNIEETYILLGYKNINSNGTVLKEFSTYLTAYKYMISMNTTSYKYYIINKGYKTL